MDADRFVLKAPASIAPQPDPPAIAFDPEKADPRYARAADRFRSDYSIAAGMGRRLPFKWARAGTYERGARERLVELERLLGRPKQRLIERRVIARASVNRLSLETRDSNAKIMSDLEAAYEALSRFYLNPRAASRTERTRFIANTGNHGGEPIGALLRERAGHTDLLEEAFGIENRDGRRWRAIEQPDEYGDET
jgi:hypothetical protein